MHLSSVLLRKLLRLSIGKCFTPNFVNYVNAVLQAGKIIIYSIQSKIVIDIINPFYRCPVKNVSLSHIKVAYIIIYDK